jgi:hypothetical protein
MAHGGTHHSAGSYRTNRGEELWTQPGTSDIGPIGPTMPELLGIFQSPETATEYAQLRSWRERFPNRQGQQLPPEIARGVYPYAGNVGTGGEFVPAFDPVSPTHTAIRSSLGGLHKYANDFQTRPWAPDSPRPVPRAQWPMGTPFPGNLARFRELTDEMRREIERGRSAQMRDIEASRPRSVSASILEYLGLQ